MLVKIDNLLNHCCRTGESFYSNKLRRLPGWCSKLLKVYRVSLLVTNKALTLQLINHLKSSDVKVFVEPGQMYMFSTMKQEANVLLFPSILEK